VPEAAVRQAKRLARNSPKTGKRLLFKGIDGSLPAQSDLKYLQLAAACPDQLPDGTPFGDRLG